MVSIKIIVLIRLRLDGDQSIGTMLTFGQAEVPYDNRL